MTDEGLKSLEIAREVDCEGEVCPGPVLKTMEALNDVEPGAVVVLRTDLRMAVENVRIAVETGGLAESLGVLEEDGLFHLYLERL